ncbi:MAG: DUF362 domain-containing protein [Candidatus Methylomirabilia bacterium]
MKRRELCKFAAVAAGAAILAPVGRLLGSASATVAAGTAGGASAPALAAVKGAPGAATRRAVELLGGMGKFVRPGQKIVVKPNIGWDRTLEQAANTHPEVVVAVARMCLEAGAGEVLVFDRTCNDQRLCYRRSGIEAAVEAIADRRVRIVQPDERRYSAVAIPGGKVLTSWEFYEEALAADVFINVPIAKHHGLTVLTMSMKNVMGVAGGNRGRIHTDFDDKIVDLNLGRKSHLVVLDATRILVAHGPQGGNLADVQHPGVVVAGTDVVAVDAYGTRFFNKTPRDIPHIVRAAERGLGTMDLAQVALKEEAV